MMRVNGSLRSWPGGGIALAGTLLLAALIPLVRYPTLVGSAVIPFLISFCAAWLAYGLALKRLSLEHPGRKLIWTFAISFRLMMLLTPATLSEDVYRYIWDGHLIVAGVNPYADPVNSPRLDAYDTPLRERVNFPWMSTPYLPAAQVYFGLVEKIAPQSPFAFQLAAAALDLAAAVMVTGVLRRVAIPEKAVLIYLWNPLVVIEFAHGAHVDALMLFCLVLALYGLTRGGQCGLILSVFGMGAAVLVKGWPILAVPLLIRRWGIWRTVLFGLSVALPLAVFAASAGWGLVGPADGRGVFGAVRIYSNGWVFNSGLYHWLALLLSPQAARLIAFGVPALAGLLVGWQTRRGKGSNPSELIAETRQLIRWAALPFGLYLVLAPTVHPWYLTLVLVLLPFFWPAPGEDGRTRRWIWPWVYFTLFEGFTYLAYSGVTRPPGLQLIQTAGYMPLWGLLAYAAWQSIPRNNRDGADIIEQRL